MYLAIHGVLRIVSSVFRWIYHAIKALLYIITGLFHTKRYLGLFSSFHIPPILFFLLSLFIAERILALVRQEDLFLPSASLLTPLCQRLPSFLQGYELQLIRLLPILRILEWTFVAWLLLSMISRIQKQKAVSFKMVSSPMIFIVAGPITLLQLLTEIVGKRLLDWAEMNISIYRVEYDSLFLFLASLTGLFTLTSFVTILYFRAVAQTTLFKAFLTTICASVLTAAVSISIQILAIDWYSVQFRLGIAQTLYEYGSDFESEPSDISSLASEPKYRMWQEGETGYVVKIDNWSNQYAIYLTPKILEPTDYAFVYFRGAIRVAQGRKATVFDLPILPDMLARGKFPGPFAF